MAKVARERAKQEKREAKAQKKEERKRAKAEGIELGEEPATDASFFADGSSE
jgi:hypothetical protein